MMYNSMRAFLLFFWGFLSYHINVATIFCQVHTEETVLFLNPTHIFLKNKYFKGPLIYAGTYINY